MIEVRQTEVFTDWLGRLRDTRAQAKIAGRIARLADGNLGDVKSVGDGISELRVNFGPGYRLYFVRQGTAIVVLLCGGDKGSQGRDIKRAKALADQLED
jgi:putative addiction module killer protein